MCPRHVGREAVTNAAGFTVLLKEEKTRIREHEEREQKKAAQGPWVHLPNRRVNGQRPYYSW